MSAVAEKATAAHKGTAHAPAQHAKKAPAGANAGDRMIAVIRIRGTAGVLPDVRTTFRQLRLFKSNHLVLVKSDRQTRKMVDKVKDSATYGEVDEATVAAILEKRGRSFGNHRITEEFLKAKNTSIGQIANALVLGKQKLNDFGLEPVFRLNPPKKGHERKGIKKHYRLGGALGYRGMEIKELIMRMI